MSNLSQIDVQYRHVPSETVKDFETLKSSDLNITLFHDRLEHFSFTGGPSDILVYINNHLTELIVNGVIVSAVYDAIKQCTKVVWKKIVKYYSSRKSKYYDDQTSITLSFEIKPDKTIEYQLDGKVDLEKIDDLIEELFRHISNRSIIESNLSNPEFLSDSSEKPKVRMSFNKETGKWEPVNYAKLRKDIRDQIKRFEDEIGDYP